MLCPACKKTLLTGKKVRCALCQRIRNNEQCKANYWANHERSIESIKRYKKLVNIRSVRLSGRRTIYAKCPHCKALYTFQGKTMNHQEGTKERPLWKSCEGHNLMRFELSATEAW